MLDSLFYSLLDMSLSASVVILVVLAARLALKRVPALFSYLLWAVVFFRLLCPAAIPLPAALSGAGGPILPTGELLAGPQAPAEAPPLAPMESAVDLLPWLWLLGVLLLSLRSLLSLARLRRRLAGAVPLARGLYLTDAIPTPFVLGLIHLRIYLPSGLPEESRDHIIRHEQTHIRRGDPLWKALAFAALTLHWFNPLVWLAFFLAERDMELSCDERAVKGLDQNARADYAALLLDLSAGICRAVSGLWRGQHLGPNQESAEKQETLPVGGGCRGGLRPGPDDDPNHKARRPSAPGNRDYGHPHQRRGPDRLRQLHQHSGRRDDLAPGGGYHAAQGDPCGGTGRGGRNPVGSGNQRRRFGPLWLSPRRRALPGPGGTDPGELGHD